MADDDTRAKLGEPLRRPAPCARCGHPEIVRALVKEQRMAGEKIMLYPLAVARMVRNTVRRSFFGEVVRDRRLQIVDEPRGKLEAYVCRSCGYVEWYARDPKDIPIADENDTELLVYDERYR